MKETGWSRRQALVVLGAGAAASASGCALLRGGASHPRAVLEKGSLAGSTLTVPLAALSATREGKALLIAPGKPYPELLVAARAGGGFDVVTAECTHWGCTVGWNAAAREWQCPCHDSRFAADGRVLQGPAKLPLRTPRLERRGDALVLDLSALARA